MLKVKCKYVCILYLYLYCALCIYFDVFVILTRSLGGDHHMSHVYGKRRGGGEEEDSELEFSSGRIFKSHVARTKLF